MAANKIIIGGETKLDLTADTVTADTLVSGITAHDKSGNLIMGTLQEYNGEVSDVQIN